MSKSKLDIKVAEPPTWLLGTWRSDKALTIRRWGRHVPTPEDHREFVESMLGLKTNRYTAKRWYHTYDGHGFVLPCRVVWHDGSSLFLVSGTKGKEAGEHIFFRSPRSYWVYSGRYIEYFSKEEGT